MMHYSGHFLAALRYLAWHYYRGNIRCPTHVERGVEACGDSLEKLFAGGHVGRLVVDVRGGGATDSEPAADVTMATRARARLCWSIFRSFNKDIGDGPSTQ